MRRREAVSLLAGALGAWPLATSAEMAERIRVVGVLIGLPESDSQSRIRVATFEQGMRDQGWIIGRNLRVYYRFAADADRLQDYGRELLGLQAEVIVASSSYVVFSLLRESRTVPIVFVTATDPIGDGFVTSLARPGRNATGFTNNFSSIGGKWVELLKEIAPDVERMAILFNPGTARGSLSYFFPTFDVAARSAGVLLRALPVHNVAGMESALADFASEPGGALIVVPDNFTSVHRRLIIALTAHLRVPAIYSFRYFAMDGGLMSYGVDLLDLYRRTASYVDRILKGVSPAGIPVQTPGKIELVVNLKAARELGLTVPRILLARADEVIE